MPTSKFEERENRRKSVVTGILNASPKETDYDEAAQDNETSVFAVTKVKRETRSRRVNLLVKPSVYEKATEKCETIGISFSECINQLLENWVK